MNIYFADITFNESPLIWKYDPESHSAVCLCRILARDGFFTREDVFNELKQKNYLGIEVLADSARIEDIPQFILSHPMCTLVPMLDLTAVSLKNSAQAEQDAILNHRLARAVSAVPKVTSASSSLLVEESTFSRALTVESPARKLVAAKPPKLAKAATTDHSLFAGSTPRKGSTHNLLFSPTRFNSIKLDRLISRRKDPGLWGDTCSYLEYFTEKTEEDRALRLPSCLRDEFSFHKAIQYEINDRICPIKAEQMKVIKQLLDELDPFYQLWKNSTKPLTFILKSFAKYLRHAVLNSMSNAAFNHEPTEFECLSSEQRKQKFHDNEVLYQRANHEARAVRARLMVMNWLALFDPTISLEPCIISNLLIGEEKKRIELFTAQLNDFKSFLLADSARLIYINPLINQLITLLIKSGEMEYQNTQATNALNLLLAQHQDIQLQSDKTTYYSLYLAIDQCLNTIPASSKHGLFIKPQDVAFPVSTFINEVVARVVHLLHSDKELYAKGYMPFIVRPLATCSNLFLIKNWMLAINKYLETIDWNALIKHAKGHKFNKNVEEVSGIIFYVIRDKAQAMILLNDAKEMHETSSSVPMP